MFKLFPSRQDIVLKRIEQLTHEMNKCTNAKHLAPYKRCIKRMWNKYGLERKKK